MKPTAFICRACRLAVLAFVQSQSAGSRFVSRTLASVFAALLVMAVHATAASVEPGGYVNDFSVQPPAADWATLSVAGGGNDTYDMDTDVNATITASGVTAQTVSDPANPPVANASAMWSSSSTGLYLQTRPTGNRYTVLMAKFVNNTGTNATQIRISYLLTFGGAVTTEDAGKGTRAYYSLTGLLGSWANLGDLNTTEATGSLNMSASVALNWTNGGSLYIAWLDDNATSQGTDSANEMDNFSLQVTAGSPPAFTVAVNTPANNALFVSSASITAAGAVASGTAPYTVEYFTNSGVGNTVFTSAGTSPTVPYSLSLGSLPAGTYNIYAVATDSSGVPVSTNSLTNTFFVADPIAFALTAPADGATFDNSTPVTGSTTISGGTAPYSVQFFLNNTASGAPVTAAPYEYNFGPLFVGDHTIHATVRDSNGWVSNATATVHITGPLGVELYPTNGSAINFGQDLVLTAAPGGGVAPYAATFYTNDQVVGVISAAPFVTNLGVLPVGSYTSYVYVTDSSLPDVQQAISATNVITILPNPLALVLTSPANGQTATAGTALTLSASASVTAPITVSSVQFFLDGVSVGIDSTAPYSASTIPTVGSHTVFALATDSLGRMSYSATNSFTAIASGPPANNNFANAITLSGSFVRTVGYNFNATKENFPFPYPNWEPNHAGNAGGASVWWNWTAPVSGPTTIDTIGSDFDTLLAVYTGTPDWRTGQNVTAVASNDDYNGQMTSRVQFTAVAGTLYRIAVDGFRFTTASTGNIVLNIQGADGVKITSLTNGTQFLVGDVIPLAVSISTNLPNQPTTRVEYYRGNVLVASSTNAPFDAVATNAPLGTNTFYALAYDSTGQPWTSPSVKVLVLNVGLTLLSPTEGALFGGDTAITVSVAAALPAGAMTNVEFFVDGQKFAEDASAPFSAMWTNVTSGLHKLSAAGRSDTGDAYVSQEVTIIVIKLMVAPNSVWKFLDNGSNQGTNWIAPGFDDNAWASGPGELGYGDGGEATVVNGGPTNNRYITTYFRRAFRVTQASIYTNLVLGVRRDDGAIVYLNGVEAARFNMPTGPVNYLTTTTDASDDGANYNSASINPSLLREGTNVFAVEIHQSSASSPDISFDLYLYGIPNAPENIPPVVSITSPAPNAGFIAPVAITVTAQASDADDAVAQVEFFADGVSLGVVSNPPYTVTWEGASVGVHALSAAATDTAGIYTYSYPTIIRVYSAYDQWSAYNAHVPGPATRANVTLWDVFNANSGSLTNLATAEPLPVTLTITQTGAEAEVGAGAPLADTPAYNLFNGIVDFGGGPGAGPALAGQSIVVGKNASVVHTFTGLDPSRRYSFRGTAIRGEATFKDRWSLFELQGAVSFVSAHTPGVLAGATSGLTTAQAAMNTGDNTAGEVIGWDNIAPNGDGVIAVRSAQYFGTAPGYEVPGPAGYALTAIRLDEFAAIPFVQLTQPANGLHISGLIVPTNITIAASVNAFDSVTNVLFLANGVVIANRSASPYQLNWTNTVFGDIALTAIACAGNGVRATSAPVNITIVEPPINVEAPEVVGAVPIEETTITILTNIQVTFTENVVGVEARDLLINETPATRVSGSGSNYTFTVVQPPFGLVRVHWAPDHGITDIGWPTALDFHDTSPGAVWTYNLVDRTPPVLLVKDPPPSSILSNLTRISVTFSKPVTGVDAKDLLIQSVPALSVVNTGNTNYVFTIAQPRVASVYISWASNPGIKDTATTPNNFNSTASDATWRYNLDFRSYLIQTNSVWLLQKGTAEASSPTDAWRLAAFDDSGWSNAPAPFFYGDTGYTNALISGTSLDDMRGSYSSIYLRQTFHVPNAGSVSNLYLRAQSDAGFIAWINGVEVKRYNMAAGNMPYNTNALAAVAHVNNAASLSSYTLADPHGYLLIGTNILTVQAFSSSPTNATFGFNGQIYTTMTDTEWVAPRLFTKSPAAGSVFALTNITVTFTEPVGGLKASDLLINDLPATGLVTNNGYTYTFSFPQPAFGPVAITWAADQAIVDNDISPKAFVSTDSSALWQYMLFNPTAPFLSSQSPVAGSTLTNLTQLTVSFTEPVTGVDAGDLLVNGVPANNVIGSGDTYTFQFPQPPYGAVAISWAADNGIQDQQNPPVAFDALYGTHTWGYTLVDHTPPTIATQIPTADWHVLNLTQLTVTFTEPVTGVTAGDLLINGAPATGVTGSGATYVFTFRQVNGLLINVSWAANSGIQDLSPTPNLFNAAAPDASWYYSTIDNVPPSVKTAIPAPSFMVRSLTRISVLFDEPVTGVDAGALLVNGVPALEVTGTGAGPYVYTVVPVADGIAEVTWNPANTIKDMAEEPNAFGGAGWSYTVNSKLATETAVRHVIQISLDGAGAVYLRNYITNAPTRFANFARLVREGSSTMNARCDYDISVTLPNHADMFTGLTALQAAGSTNTSYHGFSADGDTGQTLHNSGNPNVPYKMSVFDVAHDNGLSTAFLYSKKSLDIFARTWNATYGKTNEYGTAKIDNVFSTAGSSSYGPTAPVVDAVVARVATNTLWNYTFLHFDDGDATGHSSAWGSAAYSNGLAVVDVQIGRIMALIDSTPALSNQTVLMVTGDHGGGDPTTSHDRAYSLVNYTVPMFLWGPGVAQGTNLYEIFSNRADPGTNRLMYTDTSVLQPLRNGDFCNIGLSLMGLPPIPGSVFVPVFGTVPAPQISLSVMKTEDGDVRFSWPLNANGFTLQYAPTLAPAAGWQTVTDGLTTNGSLIYYRVTPTTDTPAFYFRLQKN